jgi:hypothetical protein
VELEQFPTTDSNSTDEEASSESELYNGYLNNIPEVDREIVAKYAKDWDGNVTRKMQEIHEQYKPYKDLGDPEYLGKAALLMDRFDSMPLEVYKLFRDSLVQNEEELRGKYGDQYDAILYGDSQMNEEELEGDEEYEEIELPDEIADMLQQQNTTIEELKAWKDSQESSAREAQENRELDEHLKNMHNTFLQGYKLDEDDNDWLLIQLAKEKTPEQAAEAWKKKFGGQQSQARPAAKILSGQGGVANDQVDLAKLRGQDRRKMIADILTQANQ